MWRGSEGKASGVMGQWILEGVVRKGPPEKHRRFSLSRSPEERGSLTCLGNREDSMWLELRKVRGRVVETSLTRWVSVQDRPHW